MAIPGRPGRTVQPSLVLRIMMLSKNDSQLKL